MIGKGLVNRAVATMVAAGAGFVTVVALGATAYYALLLVLPPLAASAVTAGVFGLLTLIVALVYLKKAQGQEEEIEEEPESLSTRAIHLFQERPVLGTIAALAGGLVFLRNPALATMVAAAFTEKSRRRPRR